MEDPRSEEDPVLEGTPLEEGGIVPVGMGGYGTSNFYGDALVEPKGRQAFLKEVVSMSRKSPEYSRYRSFLVDNVELDRCSVLSGLTQEEVSAAGLELHHFPLSLFDIAELVLGQMESDGVRITTFAVANAVMAQHWRGNVGLVPVTQTIHEAAHAGQVHIHPLSIFGNWRALLEENRAGIGEALAEKLRAIVDSWQTGLASEANRRALTLAPQRWTAEAPTVQTLLAPPGEGGSGV
jgi:hypothetical protein